MCPSSDPDDTETKAAALLVESMNRPGMQEAFDRAFAMTPEQLGQAALEAAQRKNQESLTGAELEFVAKRDFAKKSDAANVLHIRRDECFCGKGRYCLVHDTVVGE